MVLGILTSIAACPAIIGTTEAVRQGQAQNKREQHRGQKTNLVATCTKNSSQSSQINGGLIVLKNNKVSIPSLAQQVTLPTHSSPSLQLYIAAPTSDDDDDDDPTSDELEFECAPPHPFTGYFMPHPAHNWSWRGEGLVSTIAPGPPILNWIYVDKDTNEVKYGDKHQSAGHVMGPWNCTKIDRRMTFEGWEGFLAVREKKGEWAVYFDREDDGLKGKVLGRRMLEVEIWRRERKKGREDAENKNYNG